MDEIDKRVGRPKFPLQLGGHDLARVLQQPRKNLKRLLLEPDPQSVFVKFACAKIRLENTKTEPSRILRGF